MKTINKIISILTLFLILIVCSCDMLQSTLSSEMNKTILEESGIPTIASNYWYYNGTKDENIASTLEQGMNSSLLVSFGKKVALQTENPTGSIEIAYVGEDGLVTSKTITSLSGRFTDDYTGYKIDMSDVLEFFDTKKIPSGTASMEIKIGGFLCAEGKQNGRSIPTLEHQMTIMPLFTTYNVDFSTCWYKDGDYVSFPVNGDVTIPTTELTTKDDYKFEISAGEKEIILTPKQSIYNEIGTTKINLNDILPNTAGDSYSKEITVNFVKDAIVMDGKEDINYSNEKAVSVEDATGDQDAFASYEYDVSSNADISKVSIVNDANNLYIGVAGNLSLTWNEGLVIMIAKKGAKKVDTPIYAAANKESLKPLVAQVPFVYLYHKPGDNDSGDGKLGVYTSKSGSTTEITSKCIATPAGWTSSTTGKFLEYALPLSDLGLSADDEISVIVCASLHWDEGNAVCDIAPNNALVEKNTNEDHTEVMYDFSNGIKYTVK